MKIYYFLNNVSQNIFNTITQKTCLLKDGYTTYDLINSYYNKVWVYNADWISDPNFIEVLSFIEFFKNKYNKNYHDILESIEWIYDDNFFIYNESIYKQTDDKYIKIDLSQKIFFFTSRDSFASPFFLILNQISKKNKNISIVKYNYRPKEWSYNDKLYYISKIYDVREKYLWNIAIPFFHSPNIKNVKIFFQTMQSFFWNEIMIKKNFWDMGLWLKAIKIDELFDDRIEYIIEKFLPYNHSWFQWIYITSFMEIKKEFRVYYNNSSKWVKIYSIKNRVNTITEDIFHKPNFKIYEHVKVNWNFVDKEDFIKNNIYIDFIKKICIRVKDNCGVLEFFEDKNGKIYFCEINALGGSIMFPWIDQENMMNYYMETLENIIK